MQTEPSLSLVDPLWLAQPPAGPDGGKSPAWVRELRARGLERFRAMGFPSAREERWRALDLGPITRGNFAPAPVGALPTGLAEQLALEGAVRLTFLDGRFSPELSTPRMPQGLRALSLAEALERHPGELQPQLGRIAGLEAEPFVALNTSFLLDGACVLIAPGASIGPLVHLAFVSGGAARTMTHPRVLVVAGAGSRATVVESHLGLGDAEYFTNAVTEISLDADAALTHLTVQQQGPRGLYTGTVQVRQGPNSRLGSHVFTFGGALTRNDLGVRLEGEGAECSLDGLYAVGDRQVVDNHTTIDHLRPHGASRELYKGILGGSAKAVFNGRILVHQDAQKTNARQSNPNLLLSDEAVLSTQPQLEILADDVKCNHGTAIGRLDADALFYLRARGLDEAAARTLLIRAFAAEMLDRLDHAPLRDALDALLGRKLAGLQSVGENS